MDALEKVILLKQQLDSLRPLDPEQEGRIMQKFRLDWNYHSNHLEGNSLTYGETKALLLHHITAQGKPLKDHLEMTGHNEAIDEVIEILKNERPLTETFIRELHKLLLKERYQVSAQTPGGQPTKKWVEVGQYKTLPNHVETKSGEIFYFSPPESTAAEINALMDWYREKEEKNELHPLLLAAEFHYKFIRIHPFDDGNGRVGRILMNFILMKHGYPPVIIRSEDKENYFRALQQADGGMFEPFAQYIAENLVRSLEMMIAGAKGESIEEPDDLDKEIALLEQRMRGIGEKIEIVKSKEVILNIFNKNLTHLISHFAEQSMKLSSFYIIKEFGYFINSSGRSFNKYSEEILTYISNAINENSRIDSFKVEFDFREASIKNVELPYYRSSISIDFKLKKYIIKNDNSKASIIKLYTQEISDQEIHQIVKAETDAHLAFIKERIAEAEAKKRVEGTQE